MNRFGKILLVLSLFSVSAALSAATDRTAFAKIKVELKMEQPPVTNVSRSPASNPRVTQGHKWLVLKVGYAPQSPRDGGPNQSNFLDDVKMTVLCTFPVGGASRTGAYGMFKGEQTFWTVCCDGRQHVTMMFVPPHLLQRYLYMLDPYTGMRNLNKGDCKVEVVFTDRNGRELGRGYYGVPGSADKQDAYFRKLEAQIPENHIVDGAFMVRGATPWRTMEPDQFDFVKPEHLKLPDAPIPPRSGVLVQRGPQKGVRPSPPNPKRSGE